MNRLGARCPPGEVLSAYWDEELPDSWKQAIRQHLQGCPGCRERVARYERLRAILTGEREPEPRLPPLPDPSERMPRVPFWKRRIALPLPAALAAALLILGLGLGVVLAVVTGRTVTPWMSIRHGPAGTTELIVAAPVDDLEQLLRTLNQPPRSSELVIHLPAGSQLLMVGEPQLVREADYSRGRRW